MNMFIRTESFHEFIRMYPAVTIIISINSMIFLLTNVPFWEDRHWFESMAGVNLFIADGEYWRLITPIFLHGSFSHILFNSFSTIIFAPALEKLFGSIKMTSFYLLAGVAANILTFWLMPLKYVHVGASGAIFGLLGCYLYLVIIRKDLLTRQNSQTILTLTIIGVIMTFIQPQINVIGHLGGLVSGFILAPLFLRFRKK
jgi:rhomboid protease GluP